MIAALVVFAFFAMLWLVAEAASRCWLFRHRIRIQPRPYDWDRDGT